MTTKQQCFTNPDIGILILRVTLGGLLFLHGFHKVLHGVADQMALLASNGIPGVLIYFVYVAEVVAPVLIVLGLFTRLSALTIIVTMITVIYVLPFPIFALGPHGEWVVELQMLYLLVPAALFFLGAGRYRLCCDDNRHWLLN